jgi:hypothetical protein
MADAAVHSGGVDERVLARLDGVAEARWQERAALCETADAIIAKVARERAGQPMRSLFSAPGVRRLFKLLANEGDVFGEGPLDEGVMWHSVRVDGLDFEAADTVVRAIDDGVVTTNAKLSRALIVAAAVFLMLRDRHLVAGPRPLSIPARARCEAALLRGVDVIATANYGGELDHELDAIVDETGLNLFVDVVRGVGWTTAETEPSRSHAAYVAAWLVRGISANPKNKIALRGARWAATVICDALTICLSSAQAQTIPGLSEFLETGTLVRTAELSDMAAE